MTTPRMTPVARKAQIMDAALSVAAEGHYRYMSREDIARAAECSPGLVTAYYGGIESLRDEVLREAIRRHRLPVIAQGLAARDPLADEAPDDVKREALRGLVP